jgi:hypothetical protein
MIPDLAQRDAAPMPLSALYRKLGLLESKVLMLEAEMREVLTEIERREHSRG